MHVYSLDVSMTMSWCIMNLQNLFRGCVHCLRVCICIFNLQDLFRGFAETHRDCPPFFSACALCRRTRRPFIWHGNSLFLRSDNAVCPVCAQFPGEVVHHTWLPIEYGTWMVGELHVSTVRESHDTRALPRYYEYYYNDGGMYYYD